jgi:hypothetical protein
MWISGLVRSQKNLEIFTKSRSVEAPVGFEPTNKGFADLPLKPLGYSAILNSERKMKSVELKLSSTLLIIK